MLIYYSPNEISDVRKFKVEIEHKERTIGEGKDKRKDIYTVLKAADAEKLVKEVLMGKVGITNVPGLHTQFEQLEKFPVAKVSEPHDSKTPSPTVAAGKINETKFLS